ncbi:MAG: type II secretion system major pseudopilin GspG [Deferribacteraceae bacterium]|nr:type II secretion system major pseudopilin GspG [Deferribacteraceae bacterium]
MYDRKAKSLAGKGFTLIEILVVVAIIGIMVAAIGPNIVGYVEKSRVGRVKQDIVVLSGALQLYNLDNHVYPTTEQGLKALVEQPTSDPVPTAWQPGGYLGKTTIPKDPWDTPYVYRSPGDNGEDFVIISLGKDKREGGEGYNADIVSTNLE